MKRLTDEKLVERLQYVAAALYRWKRAGEAFSSYPQSPEERWVNERYGVMAAVIEQAIERINDNGC